MLCNADAVSLTPWIPSERKRERERVCVCLWGRERPRGWGEGQLLQKGTK